MAKQTSLEYFKRLKPGYTAKGWSIPKWILFSETMLRAGCSVEVHRAKTTVSKYVYVIHGKKTVKVRFSNHKANRYQEERQDSDFYVGRGNKGTITTGQVIPMVLKSLGVEIRGEEYA